MTCPICKENQVDSKYKPFCSKRCADIDLGNWFSGKYAFKAINVTEEEMEELEKVVSEE